MHIGAVNSIVSACELNAIHFEVSIVCGCMCFLSRMLLICKVQTYKIYLV